MTKRAAWSALEARLAYTFRDPAHLETALTHASAVEQGKGKVTYERYEFLGDRVLGLVVADMLLAAFPDADEGELNRRFVELVRKETCADVAAALGLGDGLIVGGGRANRAALGTRKVLGDICESVIAAIYLDGGPAAARAFIEANWHERMRRGRGGRRSAKTALQEWAQGRGLPPPRYHLVDRSGPDHEPEFVVEAEVDGLDPETGAGATRRKAEQAAAVRVLEREGVWPP